MMEYHKIQTVFKRDPETNNKNLLEGEYSLPEFKYLEENNWVYTEKVDGTNIRVEFDGSDIDFGGKTDRAEIPGALLTRLNYLFASKIDLFKTIFPEKPNNEGIVIYPEVCLYGEGHGAKIQKGGGNYSPTQDFVLFDVRIGHWWLKREDVEDIASKFDIGIVPIIGIGTLFNMVEMTREGFKSRWGDFIAEGIVARPEVELKTRSGHRVITKIKYKDFPRGRSNY